MAFSGLTSLNGPSLSAYFIGHNLISATISPELMSELMSDAHHLNFKKLKEIHFAHFVCRSTATSTCYHSGRLQLVLDEKNNLLGDHQFYGRPCIQNDVSRWYGVLANFGGSVRVKCLRFRLRIYCCCFMQPVSRTSKQKLLFVHKGKPFRIHQSFASQTPNILQ